MSEIPLSVLSLEPIGVAPYSIRGISEQLRESDAQLERDVNGTLTNLTPPQFRKYRLSISCTDMDSPALGGVHKGDVLTVGCVTEFGYLTSRGPGALDRTPVAGSVRVDELFTFYRPELVCMVTDYGIDTDEAGAAVGWHLDLEEV